MIREAFWRWLAMFLARDRVRGLVIRLAKRRPYTNIGDYMHRWWVVPERWGLPFAIRVHHIKRDDADPVLHDHPWDWRTIILDGWYIEEDAFGEKRVRMYGQTRAATAETLHRIDQVAPEGVWTFFITGRRKRFGRTRNEWGFIDGNPPRKIHWSEYKSPNNREAMKP